MIAQDILNSLYETKTQDPAASRCAAQIAEYTQQFQTGQLSNDEYLELIADVQLEHLIEGQCADLAAKERLNTICNAVISAANILSSV